jgi:peptide-methionine (S)-S-oxide reductase
MFSLMSDRLPRRDEALPGRAEPIAVTNMHYVLNRPIKGEFTGAERIYFGMGCFWGAEKRFWDLPGVLTTAVGYAGGLTPNPTYKEVCTGLTGHAEVVMVAYDPKGAKLDALLKIFWEQHDPTQVFRQGNDIGTQYRSVIFCTTTAQKTAALKSFETYAMRLAGAGYGAIATEVLYPPPSFYYAEDYHQQYLAKHPEGHCGLGGTGVTCPVGVPA